MSFLVINTFILLYWLNLTRSSNDFFNDSRAQFALESFHCDWRNSNEVAASLSSLGNSECYDFGDAVDMMKNLYPSRSTYDCAGKSHLPPKLCTKAQYPFKSKDNIEIANLTWSNVTLFIIAYDTQELKFLKYSLHQIFTNKQSEVIEIALVSDTCFIEKRLNDSSSFHSPIHSQIDEDPYCRDHVHLFVLAFRHIVPNIRFRIFRVHPVGGAASFHSRNCKTVIGMSKVYEYFPFKRYYFKLDLDTLLFSRRFLNFINTVESVTVPSIPLYFGSAFEHILDQKNPVYSYGGGGYGFNNVAMKKMAVRTNCEYKGKNEDSLVACRYYHLFPGGEGRLLTGGVCFGYADLKGITEHAPNEQKAMDAVLNTALEELW